MKKLFNLLLLLNIVTSLYAQKGRISGKVIIPEENKGSAVNIGIIGTPKGTITSPGGFYEITGINPGKYILEASFVGLKSEQQNIEVFAGEETIVPAIVMKKTEQKISEVQVVGNNSTNYRALVSSDALKMKTPLLQIPQNIQVITKGLLDDQQAVDMLENVTRNTSGAMMIEHWGTFARINMRGFKLPAFRNGFNVDLPWGPLTEDISLVDRIEFVKGPAGFMLSTGEPGGLYNVVTKKPQLNQMNEVSLLYGSFNTLRATADMNGKLNDNGRLLYRLNIMGLTKRAHRDYEYNKRYSVAPSLKYIINDRTTLTAEYIYQHSELLVVGSAYVFSPEGMGTLPRNYTLAEPNIDPTNVSEHNAFLTFTRKLSDNWDFTAKVSYLDYKISGSSLWADSVTTAGIYRSISIWDAISFAEQGQVYVNGRAETGSVNHTILAGLDMGNKEYYADWFQNGPLAGPDNPLTYDNPVHYVPSSVMPVWDRTQSIRKRAFGSYYANQSQSYTAFYVQDELGFFDNRLRLTLAGRYTSFNSSSYGAGTNDNIFTPRAGVNFTIDKNTSIYTLYDQSFIPQSGTTKNGNPFEPVRGNDIEFGVKRNWADNNWSSALTFYVITKKTY
nr:TonB-dependent receptor [Maribellus maritimus]